MSISFDLNIHGVKVQFAAPQQDIRDLVQSNFYHFLAEREGMPDISLQVDGYWTYGQTPRFAPSRMEMERRLGTDLYWHGEKLYWITPRIRTEAGFKNDALHVRGDYTERHDHTVRRVIIRNRSILYQNYQTLMRYVVHYPLFWWLARSRGMNALHASGVAKDDLALVFTGLNGSGKSSLACHLWMNEGFKLLSDNYLLSDGNRLYGFPEVVRTETDLTGHTGIIHTLPVPIFKKYQSVLSADMISLSALPNVLMFTSIGRKTTVTPLSPANMQQWLNRIFHFLGEFMQNAYVAFFDSPHLPTKWLPHWEEQMQQNLEVLIRSSRCYALEIGYGEPVAETAKQLLLAVS